MNDELTRTTQLAPVKDVEQTINTSLSLTDGVEKNLLANSLVGSDERLENIIGHPFQLVHYVSHNVGILEPSTGEYITGIRTVLIDVNLRRIETTSEWVIQALRQFVQLYGGCPFAPPLPVVGVKGKSRHKRDFFTLAIFTAPEVTGKNDKKK